MEWVGPKAMADVLAWRGRDIDTQRRRPREGGGRDWTDLATSPGPRVAAAARTCKRQEGPSPEPPEGGGPADTLPSDFQPPDRERATQLTELVVAATGGLISGPVPACTSGLQAAWSPRPQPDGQVCGSGFHVSFKHSCRVECKEPHIRGSLGQ